MAEERQTEETESREANPPPLDRKGFESSPEFANFREGMKRILAVPKAKLDSRVLAAKVDSPRMGDPNAPGRKRKAVDT